MEPSSKIPGVSFFKEKEKIKYIFYSLERNFLGVILRRDFYTLSCD